MLDYMLNIQSHRVRLYVMAYFYWSTSLEFSYLILNGILNDHESEQSSLTIQKRKPEVPEHPNR